MSISGLVGFVEGFGNARQAMKDRKERADTAARMDRFIETMGAYPAAASVGDAGAYGVRPQSGGYGSPGSADGAPGAGLIGLIDQTEGGANYNTLYGHSQNGGAFDGVNVSDMTLRDLYAFSDPSGAYGQWVAGRNGGTVATPMGRYQIVGTTLRSAADGMGLSPDTKFTPQIQDSMAAYLARGRLDGAKSPAAKRAALRSEWEGFKGVSDAALDAAIADFEANGGVLQTRAMGIRPQ